MCISGIGRYNIILQTDSLNKNLTIARQHHSFKVIIIIKENNELNGLLKHLFIRSYIFNHLTFGTMQAEGSCLKLMSKCFMYLVFEKVNKRV